MLFSVGRFLHGFGDLIDGFQELKMNSAKLDEFFVNHLEPLTGEAKDWRLTGMPIPVIRTVSIII
jgi:hypothetical protein